MAAGFMRAAFALFSALLLGLAFASEEIGEAARHNREIAGSLLGAKNACGASEREASEDDIFEVADLRMVSLIPQVGNVTSDLANASLLWSYSAKAPKSASFALANDRCPEGKIQFYSPGEAELEDARLEIGFCGRNSSIPLDGRKNPVALSLMPCESEGAGLFEPLHLSISGKIAMRYSYRMDYYRYGCVIFPNGSGCGCYPKLEFGMKTFEKEVAHSASFGVEVGENEWLWLNPPLGSRLDGEGMGKLVIFAKRMPSGISIGLGGGKELRATVFEYNVTAGKCGEQRVSREFSPRGDFFLNAGDDALEPFQLLGKNRTVLPFYLEFDFPGEAGLGEVMLLENDSFGFEKEHARNFTVRAPAKFEAGSAPAGGIAVKMASEGETASAGIGAPPAPRHALMIGALAALFAVPFALGARSLFLKERGES